MCAIHRALVEIVARFPTDPDTAIRRKYGRARSEGMREFWGDVYEVWMIVPRALAYRPETVREYLRGLPCK